MKNKSSKWCYFPWRFSSFRAYFGNFRVALLVKLYFQSLPTCILNWIQQNFIYELNRSDALKQNLYTTDATLAVVNLSAELNILFGVCFSGTVGSANV